MKLNLEGIDITCRKSDGYVNASSLCRAGGKLLKNWNELRRTVEYMEELSLATGIPIAKLVLPKGQSIRDTWVHPHVAMTIAGWISPHFDVRITSWIHRGCIGQ